MRRGLVAALQPLSQTSGVTAPETRYARSGDVNIAYQVIGDGPIDLLIVPGSISHIELTYELPEAHQLRRCLFELSHDSFFNGLHSSFFSQSVQA